MCRLIGVYLGKLVNYIESIVNKKLCNVYTNSFVFVLNQKIFDTFLHQLLKVPPIYLYNIVQKPPCNSNNFCCYVKLADLNIFSRNRICVENVFRYV